MVSRKSETEKIAMSFVELFDRPNYAAKREGYGLEALAWQLLNYLDKKLCINIFFVIKG